jgi:hypothetical protein
MKTLKAKKQLLLNFIIFLTIFFFFSLSRLQTNKKIASHLFISPTTTTGIQKWLQSLRTLGVRKVGGIFFSCATTSYG